MSTLNSHPTIKFLSRKYCLLFISAANIQVHFRLDFIMEAITMNPEIRLLPCEHPDLDPYCLQYRLPKNIGR